MRANRRALRSLLLLPVLLSTATRMFGAADIILINADAPRTGFNATDPASPIGGNTGTTLGDQRQQVFIRAAEIWSTHLDSAPPIRVLGAWLNLACSPTSAMLASTGPTTVYESTPGLIPGYWYPSALANKLAGYRLDPTFPDIIMFLNLQVGRRSCLGGAPFYLGLDGAAPHGTIDLLRAILHELAHGFGFMTTTGGETGEFCCGFMGSFPSIFDRFLLDKITGLHWDGMTNAQRVRSAMNGRGLLVWDGPLAVAAAPSVLQPAAEVRVTAPASAVATFHAGPASFGASTSTPLSGELMPIVGDNSTACAPLHALDTGAVEGNVALLERGSCPADVQVRNAQNAGAVGVIVVDDAPSSPPPSLDGTDPGVTIPSVIVTERNGAALLERVKYRSRTHSGVFVQLGLSRTQLAGADEQNRLLMYAPRSYMTDSLSHWDPSAFPSLLMEPDLPATRGISVEPPFDLTLPVLQQLGW